MYSMKRLKRLIIVRFSEFGKVYEVIQNMIVGVQNGPD